MSRHTPAAHQMKCRFRQPHLRPRQRRQCKRGTSGCWQQQHAHRQHLLLCRRRHPPAREKWHESVLALPVARACGSRPWHCLHATCSHDVTLYVARGWLGAGPAQLTGLSAYYCRYACVHVFVPCIHCTSHYTATSPVAITGSTIARSAAACAEGGAAEPLTATVPPPPAPAPPVVPPPCCPPPQWAIPLPALTLHVPHASWQ